MNDVEQLTLVVACIGALILNKIPEDTEKIDRMGLARLTVNLALTFLVTLGVVIPVTKIIFKAGG
jgi:hypothetical protein